jgi:hypothetical protein
MLAGSARYTMYGFVVAITILLGLISVIFGAASFTTEKEKATFELLELTPLSYTELVLGKFLHAFVIVLLVLLSSLPVLSTLFFMGGLSYLDFVLTFFYLLLFFAVVILGTTCLSIAINRTLFSIILSLLLAFALSVALAIVTAGAFRDQTELGFATISPWLVTWQQIFSPTPLKLAGHNFPVWPFYLILYSLLSLLLLAWGHNALDTRKLERNRRARLFGLLLVHVYTAIGLLCLRSRGPFGGASLRDFYQVILILIVILLPFFSIGGFTDKDRIRFRKRPLLESIRPSRLLLNDPSTGVFFLATLILTITANVVLCMGASYRAAMQYVFLLVLWIFPWFLIFTTMRFSGSSARFLFVTYLLGTILYSLIASFLDSGKTARSLFDFYLRFPLLTPLWILSILYHVISRIRYRKVPEQSVV